MQLARSLYYVLSPSMRLVSRRIFFFPADLIRLFTHKNHPLVPPRGMIFTGSGDFLRQGEIFLSYFKNLGGLQPHHAVLDVGCGIGRMAIPLTQYLDTKGSYEGFDVVRSGIRWCSKKISRLYPHFNFRHIDLHNDLYNTSSQQTPSSFIFPYGDESFDFVILTSVFTHMLPEDTAHYLKEISRVMKPGGSCLCTFFILDDESTRSMKQTHFNFKYNMGTYALMQKRVKEANVAYQLTFLQQLIAETKLETASIHHGRWSGRKDLKTLDFQDIIILKKE